MKSKKTAPEVNAGSMADIAFLLLIFFLVSTTISSDTGINRKLPRMCPPGQDCSVNIHERNILRITLNGKQEIMMEDQLIEINNLKQMVKDFIDNNGDGSCNYCNGLNLTNASDNPTEAVISLQSHSKASYELFIKVQDELTKAYYELREQYAQNVLETSTNDLTKEEIKQLKEAYPFIISEAQSN